MIRWLGWCVILVLCSGCESVKSVLGFDHKGPDEFDVVPLAPLSLPKDYQKTPSKEKVSTAKERGSTQSTQLAPSSSIAPISSSSSTQSVDKSLKDTGLEDQEVTALLLDTQEATTEKISTASTPKFLFEENISLAASPSPQQMTAPAATPERKNSVKPMHTVERVEIKTSAPSLPVLREDLSPAPLLEDPPSYQNVGEGDETSSDETFSSKKTLKPSEWKAVSLKDFQQSRPVLASLQDTPPEIENASTRTALPPFKLEGQSKKDSTNSDVAQLVGQGSTPEPYLKTAQPGSTPPRFPQTASLAKSLAATVKVKNQKLRKRRLRRRRPRVVTAVRAKPMSTRKRPLRRRRVTNAVQKTAPAPTV